ncbi:hypothetical protein BV360_02747 [Pseudomonas syringae pv. actinidiae]|nr:hypothetical protein BV340_03112 [Pseudomonas syringae pv. actinidiae]OSN18009.1 hypothetical protein BV339_03258 [Pseudomonas syringae pv. actinidiae]OSN25750.1 hypothetical protein BV341_03107 [Pseudomonas syringae pv. actinidiae]OSN33415.1 hypothetical protein BV343_03115 [Pseudomonas syringae pv. actinidiae]OSN34427.1 hypothetical protein BV342_03237 [Pseudomonas syringae pv. actinidiae]
MKRCSQPGAGLITGRRPTDQLGDHRVEIRRYLATGFNPGINAQRLPISRRKIHRCQQARAGLKIAARVFGVQPRLNGMADRLQAGLQLAERWQITGSQLHHPADQIDAPHLFGNTMLNLQARVHFQKIEALVLTVEHKLDGPGAAIIDRFGQLDRRRAQLIGHALRQVRGRGFFQYLLVAALHRTVAHAEGQHLALTIAEHLHFQMAGALDVFLDEHTRVAEIVLAEAFDGLERVCQLLGTAAHAHADTAAPRRAFEHDRVADITCRDDGRFQAVEQFGAFQQRHAVLSGQRAGRVLEAKHPQLLGRRADEGDTGVFAGLGKCSIFGEKAVTRMNGVGAAGFGDGEDLVHRQIRPGRTAFAQAVGFVGLHQVQAGGVGFAIHRHTFDLQRAQGPQNAAGNGATVGDQQFVEHGITPETQTRSVSCWEAGRPAIDLSTQRSSVAGGGRRVSRESATARASGCSRCTDCSTADSWKSARSRPSRHAARRTCRAQKYRLQRSGRRRLSPARS